MKRRAVYKIFFFLGLAYILLISGLYMFQEKLIFQANKLADDYQFKFDQPFSEISINTRENESLNALLFNPPTGISDHTVIYFHGNADNMQRWGNYAEDFTSLGYSVLMIDYSGYGKSTGFPSEESLYQDAEDTWQWARHHLRTREFIIYGRSLGTAVAANLASRHLASQLILETPFYQIIQDRLKFLFPFGLNSKFANYTYLPDIKYPITIIQGTHDWIVSMKSAQKLKPLLKPTDKFIIIEGGGHKNLRDFEKYQKELARILQY